MKTFKGRFLLFVSLVIVLSTIVFPVPGLVKEDKARTGDVVFALQAGDFSMVGGDPATLVSGGQPVLPHTIFDGLTSLDTARNCLPALAKSWKIAPDWSYMDFRLREGVKFHNGAEVTAEDVKYSFDTYMRKDVHFILKGLFKQRIKDVEVRGTYEIRINTKLPWPAWDEMFSGAAVIFPKKYREEVGDKGFANKPVGAGPFRWVEYASDEWVKVEAVKDHYRQSPKINTLKFLAVPETSTRLAMLKAGEADIIGLIGANIPQLRADPNFKVYFVKDTQGQCLLYCDLAFPNEPSPWHDKRVRMAASMAIDRKTLCEKILFGTATPAGEPIAPVTRGYDSSIKPDPYDIEAAKKLLAQAGYPNGFETDVVTKETNRYWMEAIAANLSDVGIKAKLKIYENAAWTDGVVNKKFRGLTHLATFFSGSTHVAKDAVTLFTKATNWCYSTTPEIEETVNKSVWALSDEDMAKAGRKISDLIRESRIRMILWNTHMAYGLGPRIAAWESLTGSPVPSHFEYIRLK